MVISQTRDLRPREAKRLAQATQPSDVWAKQVRPDLSDSDVGKDPLLWGVIGS